MSRIVATEYDGRGILEGIGVTFYRAARLGVWPNASEDEFCLLLMFLKSLFCLIPPCKRAVLFSPLVRCVGRYYER